MFKIEIENWICPNRAGGSPYSGGEFFREPRRGVPLRAAGAQEGRHQGFHPLVNHPFPLETAWEQMVDCVSVEKRRTAVGLPLNLFLRLFAVHRQRTATQTVYSAQSAAQGELPEGQGKVLWSMTVPRNTITSAYRLHPQDMDNLHR